MNLRELLSVAGLDHPSDLPITRITAEPERAGPGSLFVAIDTPVGKGHARLRQVVKRGASALVVERAEAVPAGTTCPVIVVEDTKRILAILASRFFEDAHRQLRIWAVTGTKGKSTVSHLLESIHRAAGVRTGLIATGIDRFEDDERSTVHMPAEVPELHESILRMHTAGATDLILEATSFSIAFGRLHGLRFAGAIFTNLGRDHLVTHGGIEAYAAAKAQLFTDFAQPSSQNMLSVVNVDDPWGQHIAQIARGTVVTYGIEHGEIRFEDLQLGPAGITGTVAGIRIESSLCGRHNAYNVTAAVALAVRSGLPATAIAAGVRELTGIPGRMERIGDASSIAAFVDYAHTPESVAAALDTLRVMYGSRRIVAVVGCSGGTDPTKRPEMARMAVARADRCVFTADNPRLEDPQSIADQMVGGLDGGGIPTWEIHLDRGAAIARGLELAAPDGVLAVLGKGDETVQEIGFEKRPFDDRAVLRAAIARANASNAVTKEA